MNSAHEIATELHDALNALLAALDAKKDTSDAVSQAYEAQANFVEYAKRERRTFHIVLNPAKNEGFITDDKDDALFASENIRASAGNSLIAEALREGYVEADEDAALPMIEVELEV